MNSNTPHTPPAKHEKRLKRHLLQVGDEIKTKHIQVVAAGVAFYFFLALFPALAALISIFGLIVSPADISSQFPTLTQYLPDQANSLIINILERIASTSGQTLGWNLVFSVLLSLWSANKGTSALFEGLHVVYDHPDKRGMLKKYVLTLGFTLGAVIIGFLAIVVVAVYPALIKSLNWESTLKTVFTFLRWPVLLGIFMVALQVFYTYAIDQPNPIKFKWISRGSIIATLLWLTGSLLFTLYVDNFASFNATYGSLAAVIILMLWFFLTAFIILLGAIVNKVWGAKGQIS